MTEVKIYELLGIKQFRMLVFKLERLIHRNDKGKNINYHIQNNSLRGVDAFTKYLFYNGAIHVRNIVFILVYYLFRLILNRPLHWYDSLVLVFLIKDIYCVMLQRYNYLRLNQHKQRIKERHLSVLIQRAKQVDLRSCDVDEINRMASFLERIRTAIDKQESIIITDEDIPTINQLTEILGKKRTA